MFLETKNKGKKQLPNMRRIICNDNGWFKNYLQWLVVYFGFCNDNGWFKISKDEKNYLQSCEVCLMVGIEFCVRQEA